MRCSSAYEGVTFVDLLSERARGEREARDAVLSTKSAWISTRLVVRLGEFAQSCPRPSLFEFALIYELALAVVLFA